MNLLNRTTRRQLLRVLTAIPEFKTGERRSLLLEHLPLELVSHLQRDSATAVDLAYIVDGCAKWERPADSSEPPPLGLLLATAREYARGAQLAQLLGLIAQLPAAVVPTAPQPACPYPGMVRFQDDRYFYGREAEIEQMVLRLRRENFLLVVGPSGSGKSSLVFAGLIPALTRTQPTAWQVISLRPGPQPTASLGAALAGDLAHPAALVTALLDTLPPADDAGRCLLLIVDQFEEVFTQAGGEEERGFIAALRTLWALPSCKVVLTMRADFYPDLMNSDLWPVRQEARREVGPLKGWALRRAIVQPADDVGVEVDGELVGRLLAEIADQPGCLPLLQETLRLLWERMTDRRLTLAAYEALGQTYAALGDGAPGGDGWASGLAVALALQADATLGKLTDPAQQAIARRIFLRLIQFGEGRPDTRRQQAEAALHATGEDQALFAQTLATLTDSRLLTVSGQEGVPEELVDIAHEALISHWPTLRGWLRERQGAEQTRRRFEDKAAEWVRLGRGRRGLLDDEIELAEVERWLASADAGELGYSADLAALVAASQAALAAAKAREEAARQREEEARRREEEARQRELQLQAEALHLREEALRVAEEARRRDEEARRREEEARQREWQLQAEALHLREEALRVAEEARQHEEEARQREEEARRRELLLKRQSLRRARIIIGILSAILLFAGLVFSLSSIRRWRAQGDMAAIPAGPYILGAADAPLGNEKPPWPTVLPAFRIDKLEVANWQYQLCMDDGKCSAPLSPSGDDVFAKYPHHPVVGVTALQAADYCSWLGQLLPTEVEWERAARGAERRLWPWGNVPETPVAGYANVLYSGVITRSLQDVESNPLGATPEGMLNLVGNAIEWTRSYYTSNYNKYQANEHTWVGISVPRNSLVTRGGGYRDIAIERITRRVSANWFTDAVLAVGIRCAADP